MTLQRWVLRSGKFPAFRWAYLAIYRTTGRALRWFWLLRFPLIESVVVHRGMNSPDCVPGASDIDLRIVIKASSLADEQEFLTAFWTRYASLKRLLPFLGEVQIINAREAAFIKEWGGVRERGPAGGPGLRFSWECLTEALASCLFLLQHTYFSADVEAAADFGFKIAKGFLDTSRHAAASRGLASVSSRADWLRSLEGMAIHDALADPRRIDQHRALEFAAVALQELETACREFITAAVREGLEAMPAACPSPWNGDLPNSELFVWQRRVKIFDSEAFPKVHGLYYESMYRWLVLADVADRPALKRLFQQLRRWPRENSAFENPSLLISPAILQMLLWTSYLDTPFFYYALCSSLNPHGVAVRLRGRSPLLGWGQRAQWRIASPDFLPPPKKLFELSFGHSLSNLALSLRLFGLDGWAGDNTYRIGLLYSRLLSAHLYQEKSVISDPDDMDRLLKDYAAYLPEYYAQIAGPLLEDLGRTRDDFNALSPSACFYRHYPSYRLLLDRLLDGAKCSGGRAVPQ